MTTTKFENARQFARAAVDDMLCAVTSNTSSARLRLTGENSPYQFVWIMIDRYVPTGDTSGEAATQEPQLWAHTNDADFMVGYPPSLSITAPFSEAYDLKEKILAFVDETIANYGKVEALMQSDALDRSEHRPIFVGDSESGYDAAHPFDTGNAL